MTTEQERLIERLALKIADLQSKKAFLVVDIQNQLANRERDYREYLKDGALLEADIARAYMTVYREVLLLLGVEAENVRRNKKDE